MHRMLSQWAAPSRFYALAGRLIPYLAVLSAVLIAAGAFGGLVLAPADYQQGDAYRIIFVHVPSAWLSLFVYAVMAGAAAIGLIWRIKLAEIIATASAPIGAAFTLVTLATGSLWGKPMWGTWWVWDARLTSELVLLFLYLGYMALQAAVEDPRTAARASGVLAVVGVVNLPIIHYSVQWWHTLHQGPSVTQLDTPAIHPAMLAPLLLMAAGFMSYYAVVLLMRARCEILDRERRTSWVAALAEEHS